MQNMRSIEIDFEVNKRIEIERSSFSETPNDVLRRLLNIVDVSPTPIKIAISAGGPWSSKGVTLPHGTELRMEYNGKVHSGRIENGHWFIEGKQFTSPSSAASGVARTKNGKTTNLDGWIYWRVKRPGDSDWIAIADLKPKMSDAEFDELLKNI